MIFFSSSALACKCGHVIKSLDKRAAYIFSHADNVFLAKIIKSKLVGTEKGDTTTRHQFKMIESYKGKPDSFQYLQTGSNPSSSCSDDRILEGNYYLIFSNSKELSDCSISEVDLDSEIEEHKTYYAELFSKLSELRNSQHSQKSDIDIKPTQHD